MTDEQLEIENGRYVDSFIVLPLASGRVAILGPRRDLFSVVDSWEEALKVGPTSIEARATPKPRIVVNLEN